MKRKANKIMLTYMLTLQQLCAIDNAAKMNNVRHIVKIQHSNAISKLFFVLNPNSKDAW